MEESLCNFIFRKLKYDKYLALEVIFYIKHPDIYNFMFSVSKDTRKFLQTNFITARNGFINVGLITY